MIPRVVAPDSELNMTPMIDIVFQLILFFLFNLRFKSQDWRIEQALPNVGPDAKPIVIPIAPRIRAMLFRENAEDRDRAYTKVRIGTTDFVLPGDATPSPERAAAVERIRARIASLHALTGEPGEIATPAPKGNYVPHADVVSVLDAFLEAQVTDIAFEGTRAPMP